MVQTLTADRADETFRERVRPRRPHRCPDNSGSDRGEHSVESAGELSIPIADQELELPDPLLKVAQQVTRLLGDPRAARMPGHTQNVDPAGLDLDDEEHIDPAEQNRVNVEEVTRQHPICLGAQELPPAHTGPPRRASDARDNEDPPHGALPHPVAQPVCFTLDASITPPRVLPSDA